MYRAGSQAGTRGHHHGLQRPPEPAKPEGQPAQAGDQLLLALADRLRAHSGRLGALARLGGDQFALVQAKIEQPYEAAELAQNILDELEAPFIVGEQQIRLRATIGITLFPEDGDNTEKLLQKAEQTMTLAKARSRNRYQFYIASVDSEMRRRRELEKDLREALPGCAAAVSFSFGEGLSKDGLLLTEPSVRAYR